MEKKYEKIVGQLGAEKIRLNEPLSKHTTFRIGGPADLLYEAGTEEEFLRALKAVTEVKIPYVILGGGSNVLAGDKGFRGMIIKCQMSKVKCQRSRGKFLVSAEAGVLVSVLLKELLKNSAAGLEFMAGIPGTIGGATVGNAGAWQQNISDKVLRVKILDGEGKIKWILRKDCWFDYRKSRFKYGKEIILEVELTLVTGDREKIQKEIEFNLEKRKCLPSEPSAGCIFINPRPERAGELIDKCGFKGLRIGKAMISEKHANYIVNLGKAKAIDVLGLIEVARQKVKEMFGIDLKEEIVKIGEF